MNDNNGPASDDDEDTMTTYPDSSHSVYHQDDDLPYAGASPTIPVATTNTTTQAGPSSHDADGS